MNSSSFQESIEITGTIYNSIGDYLDEMKWTELTGEELRKDLDSFRILPHLFRRGVSLFIMNVYPTVSDRSQAPRALADHSGTTSLSGRAFSAFISNPFQKAYLAKTLQDETFREELLSTGSKPIFYTYEYDGFLGTGNRCANVRQWFERTANVNTALVYPMEYPIVQKHFSCMPKIVNPYDDTSYGYNVLGAMLMALRNKVGVFFLT
jgi:predicted NAD-dependent protein-ADP-ribosyltransferase YbiA (DUF1768 family)